MEEQINQTLMNKTNKVKAHICEELAELNKKLALNYEDFSADMQDNYNFTQGLLTFIYCKDVFKGLISYLEDEERKYVELEQTEIKEGRYNVERK
ncbi:MAG: hypothetical protein ACI4MN_02135 [Candidatus Coproplasma sp.]